MEGSRERCRERDLMERRQARKKRGHLPSGGRGSGGRWSWCVGETTGLDQWLGRMLRRVLALGVPARRAPPAANAQVGQAVAPVSGSGRNSRVVQGFNVRKREPGRVDGRGRVQAARRKQDLPGHPPSAENLEDDPLWAIRSTSMAVPLAARYCVLRTALPTAYRYYCVPLLRTAASLAPENARQTSARGFSPASALPQWTGWTGWPRSSFRGRRRHRRPLLSGLWGLLIVVAACRARQRQLAPLGCNASGPCHTAARRSTLDTDIRRAIFCCSAPSWAIVGHDGPQLGRTPFFPLPLLHCCVCETITLLLIETRSQPGAKMRPIRSPVVNLVVQVII